MHFHLISETVAMSYFSSEHSMHTINLQGGIPGIGKHVCRHCPLASDLLSCFTDPSPPEQVGEAVSPRCFTCQTSDLGGQSTSSMFT